MGVVGVYTSTFGAAGFRLTGNNAGIPDPPGEVLFQKDKIPYGDLATVQIGGTTTGNLSVQAILDAADYPALRALHGQTSTLTLKDRSPRTALLIVGQPEFFREGHVIVPLTFVFA